VATRAKLIALEIIEVDWFSGISARVIYGLRFSRRHKISAA